MSGAEHASSVCVLCRAMKMPYGQLPVARQAGSAGSAVLDGKHAYEMFPHLVAGCPPAQILPKHTRARRAIDHVCGLKPAVVCQHTQQQRCWPVPGSPARYQATALLVDVRTGHGSVDNRRRCSVDGARARESMGPFAPTTHLQKAGQLSAASGAVIPPSTPVGTRVAWRRRPKLIKEQSEYCSDQRAGPAEKNLDVKGGKPCR